MLPVVVFTYGSLTALFPTHHQLRDPTSLTRCPDPSFLKADGGDKLSKNPGASDSRLRKKSKYTVTGSDKDKQDQT